MAFFQGSIFSQSLSMSTALAVSLPQNAPDGEEPPVLYLLHGLSDDASCWWRRTGIDRYAEEAGIAVVMPEVQRSFYCDMQYGLAYFSYVADELPALCASLFHVSRRREDTFVAGLSMGGYGAMKVAMSRPDRFAAAASFSGAVDVRSRFMPDNPEFIAINGGHMRDEDDLFLLAQTVEKNKRPRLYMSCGREDYLLEDNQRFTAHLDALGWGHTYESWEGAHEWRFWDASVQRALRFFRQKQS